MVDKGIIKYVKENLEKGFSVQEIKKTLVSQEIPLSKINEALEEAKKQKELDLKPRIGPTKTVVKKIKIFSLKIFLSILFAIIVVGILLFLLLTSNRSLKAAVFVDEFSLTDGVLFNLIEGSKIKFELGAENYTLIIKSINGSSVCIYGDFEEKCFFLGKGEMVLTLNGDLEQDLTLRLDKIEEENAELLIKKHGSFVCPENWKCTEWGICINDAQKRVCVDMNSCATEKDKPNLEKECEIITNSSGSSLFNFEEECIDYALPDCGTSFLDVVPLYEEDCGLVCFGKNLLENCEETNLTFTYEDGSKEVFQSLGSDSENCFLKHEILIESPDFPGSQGVYLECPISLDSILDLSCYNDECSVLGMPGQTTFNMLSFMWEDAFYNPDTLCSGSMIAYYENFGS